MASITKLSGLAPLATAALLLGAGCNNDPGSVLVTGEPDHGEHRRRGVPNEQHVQRAARVPLECETKLAVHVATQPFQSAGCAVESARRSGSVVAEQCDERFHGPGEARG